MYPKSCSSTLFQEGVHKSFYFTMSFRDLVNMLHKYATVTDQWKVVKESEHKMCLVFASGRAMDLVRVFELGFVLGCEANY